MSGTRQRQTKHTNTTSHRTDSPWTGVRNETKTMHTNTTSHRTDSPWTGVRNETKTNKTHIIYLLGQEYY